MPSLNPAVASALRAAFGEGEKAKNLESNNAVPVVSKEPQADERAGRGNKGSRSVLKQGNEDLSSPKTSSSPSARPPDPSMTNLLSEIEQRRKRYQDSIGKAQSDGAGAALSVVKEQVENIVPEERTIPHRVGTPLPDQDQSVKPDAEKSPPLRIRKRTSKLKIKRSNPLKVKRRETLAVRRLAADALCSILPDCPSCTNVRVHPVRPDLPVPPVSPVRQVKTDLEGPRPSLKSRRRQKGKIKVKRVNPTDPGGLVRKFLVSNRHPKVKKYLSTPLRGAKVSRKSRAKANLGESSSPKHVEKTVSISKAASSEKLKADPAGEGPAASELHRSIESSHRRAILFHEQLQELKLPDYVQKVIIQTVMEHTGKNPKVSQKPVRPTSKPVTHVRSKSQAKSIKDTSPSSSVSHKNEMLQGRSMKEALLSSVPYGASVANASQKVATPPFVAKGLLNPKKAERKIADMERLKSPITQVDAKRLEITALDVGQPNVPSLSYGLDRVLFNPGVYQLQDPRSRVYNFDPYLQAIMPASEFDYSALGGFITSSRDDCLRNLAKSYNKRYIGSTSSMSSVLSHFHFLLSQWREINAMTLSKSFPANLSSFTVLSRSPQAIFLKWQNGMYAIDADKEFASTNVLSMLGRSMEKLLTLDTKDFERYRKSDENTSMESQPESYHYTTMGDFLMRSQLDAHDSRLPGTGMFDLKTRAVVSVRMDSQSPELGSGYEIKGRFGEWESYEREYYDMIRAAMLKYSLQVRMGRMDGIFVAYHNTERIFGFQYMSLPELDLALHGQEEIILGDQEFKISLDLLNKILNKATEKYPGQSLRLHFETREAQTTFMYAFAEPVTEEQLHEIQSKNNAKMAELERNILGLDPDLEDLDDEKAAHQWSEIHASVEETMDNDERSLIEDNKSLPDEISEIAKDDSTAIGSEKLSDSIVDTSELSKTLEGSEGLEETESMPSSLAPEGEVEGPAESSLQDDLIKQQLEREDQVDDLETRRGDEESGAMYLESQRPTVALAVEGNKTIETPDEGFEQTLSQYPKAAEPDLRETAMNTDDLEIIYEDEVGSPKALESPDFVATPSPKAEVLLGVPEEGFESLSQDFEDLETRPQSVLDEMTSMLDGSEMTASGNPALTQLNLEDYSNILGSDEIIPSEILDVRPTPQEETDQPVIDGSTPSKADAAFLDEIIRESEEVQGKTSEVLGMVLTIRNKVNGGYVLRPTNLGTKDDWAVEYTLEEVTGNRAWSLYEACKLRRKKGLETAEKTDEQAAADYYLQQMRHLSREGKKYRKKMNKVDKNRPVVVYGHSPSKEHVREEKVEETD